MSLVFRQAGVYLKTLAGVVIAVFMLVFFLANRGNKTDLWLFSQFTGDRRVPTGLVVFGSLVAGVLLWWLSRWMLGLPGQWRSIRRDARSRDLPADQDDRGSQ
jgi:uncharacterized integral membrane protein